MFYRFYAPFSVRVGSRGGFFVAGDFLVAHRRVGFKLKVDFGRLIDINENSFFVWLCSVFGTCIVRIVLSKGVGVCAIENSI